MEKKANLIYKKALDFFTKILGNGETLQTDLDSIGKLFFQNKWSGVFPYNMLKLSKSKPYAIINLDKFGEPGSHWISVIYLSDSDRLVYDSFGRKIQLNGKTKKIIHSEDDAEQRTNEYNCGQRSLSFIFIFDQYDMNFALYI